MREKQQGFIQHGHATKRIILQERKGNDEEIVLVICVLVFLDAKPKKHVVNLIR